jgi:membrane protein
MPNLNPLVKKFDAFQRRHRWLGFPIAVVKKYSDDEAGQQAALLTYYAFLSLFPLLLVLTTAADYVIGNHPALEKNIIDSVSTYFPLLGNQLASHVHVIHKSGLALVAGLLFTFYGARGVADAFRNGVQNIWEVPKSRRAGFPKAALKSLGIIVVGGIGFILASVMAGVAGSAGRGPMFWALSTIITLAILFTVFLFMINFSLPKHISVKEIWPGAASAAVGLVVLQSLGALLLSRELKNLDALYSYFAVALSLLFWIYLQAQVLYYSVEIAVVSSSGKWPRKLI